MNLLRDLSLILLAGEAFILALIPLALFGGLVYGMWQMLKHENLPSWFKMAQAYLGLGLAYVELAMAAIIRPIVLLNSALATVQGWLGAVAKFTTEEGQ